MAYRLEKYAGKDRIKAYLRYFLGLSVHWSFTAFKPVVDELAWDVSEKYADKRFSTQDVNEILDAISVGRSREENVNVVAVPAAGSDYRYKYRHGRAVLVSSTQKTIPETQEHSVQ
jgi:hypothetical protein